MKKILTEDAARLRCCNCVALVEGKGGTWMCDEEGTTCQEVLICPENIEICDGRYVIDDIGRDNIDRKISNVDMYLRCDGCAYCEKESDLCAERDTYNPRWYCGSHDAFCVELDECDIEDTLKVNYKTDKKRNIEYWDHIGGLSKNLVEDISAFAENAGDITLADADIREIGEDIIDMLIERLKDKGLSYPDIGGFLFSRCF
ncbi:MAG: hypothetical protein UH542_00965 [Bacteroidales bacterium]|nr:hypothetical protein [Bacteroidales bacterium]